MDHSHFSMLLDLTTAFIYNYQYPMWSIAIRQTDFSCCWGYTILISFQVTELNHPGLSYLCSCLLPAYPLLTLRVLAIPVHTLLTLRVVVANDKRSVKAN